MLNEKEQKQLVALLERLEPGFYPIEIFWQFARLNTLAIIELIPLCTLDGRLNVLLTQREKQDKFWPGQWHIPGTVMRPDDNEKTALKRIVKDELADISVGEVAPIITDIRRSKRGSEQSKVFIVEIDGRGLNVGQLFKVTDLPENTVDGHRYLIELAAKTFLDRD